MNKHRLFSNGASCLRDQKVSHYCLKAPFNPPQIYPELPFIKKTNKDNLVYSMVRDLFAKLGMDRENKGTSKWNPFREIIKPGDKVLIKPNLVTHCHYLGENALYSTVIHGSILRPVIDYVYLALGGKGSILIADNPVEHADFKLIMEFTGIQTMAEELSKDGYFGLKVLDLRPKVLRKGKKGNFYCENSPGDPLGYMTVNLGKNSLFSEFDEDPEVHFYTLADPLIDHFDPKCVRESTTDKYHNFSEHKYVISKSVLDADVIINIAKMKTHCKAGVSLTLKNIIGIVHEKHCLPHHRPGAPPSGDSFPHQPASHYVISRKLYRTLRKNLLIHRLPGFSAFRNLLQKKRILIGQHTEHGNWKGNDTIWRTILDLNRIALYANKEGRMQAIPQRRYFALLDGIIAQQGDGPMCGEPITAASIFGGFNPVVVDAMAVKSMGLDYHLIKSIAKAKEIEKWKLFPDDKVDFSFPNNEVPNVTFKLPKGWS